MKTTLLLFMMGVLANLSIQAQADCTGFSATTESFPSRCASTGAIVIHPTGGSGEFGYRVEGTLNTPQTSSDTITGLPPGTYTVYVKDILNGCVVSQPGIIVSGNYQDPRFDLAKTDVSCVGANNGSVTVINQINGLNPFTYTIVAPSPQAVGTSNATGVFTGLGAGRYYVRLSDSCGGIQTRSIQVLDYLWSISNTSVVKSGCNSVNVAVTLSDNKGNSNTSGAAFAGFRYGYVNSPGDTTWGTSRTFTYTRVPLRSVVCVVKDNCGLVKTFSWTNPVPSVNASINASGLACSTFNISIGSQSNLSSPSFTLKQGATVISTNSTGTFNNIPYGSYCMDIRDACYDTTITRCITRTKPVPSISDSVLVTNRLCSTFDAIVQGKTNLFNPQFCIYNSSNTLIACNSTGTFTGLAYGVYTVRTTSSAPCYDTVITRTFTAVQPVPSVSTFVTTSNRTCSGFTASIQGQTNLFNASYCLYDNLGTLISCNTTGVFNNLGYGSYCMRLTSSTPCYDTTIIRCFSEVAPSTGAANPSLSNYTCTTFRVSIPSVTNLTNPDYCLYDNAHNLIGCNKTGVFNNVVYGSYSIEITPQGTNGGCSTAPVIKYFTGTKPVSSVATSVSISNKTCSDFRATITGQTNLTNPNYCLYNNLGTLITCNNTGVFSSLNYGSYCIQIANGCGDTTIQRCFTVSQPLPSVSATADASCTVNMTDIQVTPSNGLSNYNLRVLNPINAVVASRNNVSGSYTFTNLPTLGPGMMYKAVVIDKCGSTDTVLVSPVAGIFQRTNNIEGKCPSAEAGDGAGDLRLNVVSTLGFPAPQIIRKNGATVSINYNTVSSISSTEKEYVFQDLDPATYVVYYNLSGCGTPVYDTVTVSVYQYPTLGNSAAYQCDNNSFSVNAVASRGVAPFGYEIIGSNPTGPSIVTTPQANPIFNINTGENYSLVRLRAIDACGNATLNDVSVLPLGNLSISSSNFDCYYNDITLTVDTIPNASYTWYQKTSDTDSVLVGNSQDYNMPYLLPSDTGTYVAVTSVNGGCLMRISTYHIGGQCGGGVLPVKLLSFGAQPSGAAVAVRFKTANEQGVGSYIIQRRIAGRAEFTNLATLAGRNRNSIEDYTYSDPVNMSGKLEYRILISSPKGNEVFSQTVLVNINGNDWFDIHPNPATDKITVRVQRENDAALDIKLMSANGAVLFQQRTARERYSAVTVNRSATMASGYYLLLIRNLDSGTTETRKIFFQ